MMCAEPLAGCVAGRRWPMLLCNMCTSSRAIHCTGDIGLTSGFVPLLQTARIDDAWALVAEMQSHGIEPDEFAYTSIINGYKRASPVRASLLLKPQIVRWLEARLEARLNTGPLLVELQLNLDGGESCAQ